MIEDLREKEIITEKEAESINPLKIYEFTKTNISKGKKLFLAFFYALKSAPNDYFIAYKLPFFTPLQSIIQ